MVMKKNGQPQKDCDWDKNHKEALEIYNKALKNVRLSNKGTESGSRP